MEIHNTTEDIVYNSVQTIFESIKTEGNPEKICLCEQCKMDTICYALNRIEPRYIVSNRGFTRMEQEGIEKQQIEADVASVIYKGLRLVNHNQRPTSPHNGSAAPGEAAPKLAFDIPAIIGRLFDGNTFNPLSDVKVELYCDDELVPMRNSNWQNPYALVTYTPGTYTFWPAPVPAESADIRRTFKYALKIESPDYETLTHFFKIPVVSKMQTSYSYSLDRTFKLPDLYIFPPGEAEKNGYQD